MNNINKYTFESIITISPEIDFEKIYLFIRDNVADKCKKNIITEFEITPRYWLSEIFKINLNDYESDFIYDMNCNVLDKVTKDFKIWVEENIK